MHALMAMGLSLALLVALLRNRIRVGRALAMAALLLAVLLYVSPADLWTTLVQEWRAHSLTQTTPYLFVSLSALVMLVNVLGATLQTAGLSQRLIPALHGLFRSRRVALAAIPMIMGTLPTPGGIMLSAPMVRELGDYLGVDRSRQAAINFLFRHQWEPVWPLFPAVPLTMGIFGISAATLLAHNFILPVAGILAGTAFQLLPSVGDKRIEKVAGRRFQHHLGDFARAFWPVVFTGLIFALWDIPPAVGILISIFALFLLHRVPRGDWGRLFRLGLEWDFVLLIFAALWFKLNLQAAGAIPEVVAFFQEMQVPPPVIIFTLPFLVSFLTGVTTPTVAIIFPLLLGYIGQGEDARIGLQTLAFAGLLCGLYLTPVHLCLSLSCGYFQAPLGRILKWMIGPTIAIALAGVIMALLA